MVARHLVNLFTQTGARAHNWKKMSSRPDGARAGATVTAIVGGNSVFPYWCFYVRSNFFNYDLALKSCWCH